MKCLDIMHAECCMFEFARYKSPYVCYVWMYKANCFSCVPKIVACIYTFHIVRAFLYLSLVRWPTSALIMQLRPSMVFLHYCNTKSNYCVYMLCRARPIGSNGSMNNARTFTAIRACSLYCTNIYMGYICFSL